MPDISPEETRRYQSFIRSEAWFSGNTTFPNFIAGKVYLRTSIFRNQPDITTIPAKGVLQMSKVVYAEMDVRPWSM